MTMILVARSTKGGLHLSGFDERARSHRRVRLAVAAGAALCMVAGILLTLRIASPAGRMLARIGALNQQLNAQKIQLQRVRSDAQHAMDQMAVKLGVLQARAVRLDALGRRLVKAGKLDPSEFDFAESPALGGPEQSVPPARSLPLDLSVSMDRLAHRFDTQQTELGVLQSLLTNRQVDANLVPTGMPVADGYIASYFGPRIDPFTGRRSFHPGLDIDVAWGTPVRAVADGVVTYAGVRKGYGKVVEIDHGDGYMTRYAHNSRLLSHVGERVHAGEVISDVGSTGRSTGPHVHFEVWHDGRVVNPLAFVRSHRG
jgi:murein DD-endopeptidase MepM/ murein hydrolase activator NlpD